MAEKVCGEIKEVLPEENVFEVVFKYIHQNSWKTLSIKDIVLIVI